MVNQFELQETQVSVIHLINNLKPNQVNPGWRFNPASKTIKAGAMKPDENKKSIEALTSPIIPGLEDIQLGKNYRYLSQGLNKEQNK